MIDMIVEGRCVHADDKYSAFVKLYSDCALVSIYSRKPSGWPDFATPVSQYETARRGATASARREARRLRERGE